MALCNEFKSWFKFYLTECGGSVRDYYHDQISDDSKAAWGFRHRINANEFTLVELKAEANYWALAAADAYEREADAIEQEAFQAEVEASPYATAAGSYGYYQPEDCPWDQITTTLERGDLLPVR